MRKRWRELHLLHHKLLWHTSGPPPMGTLAWNFYNLPATISKRLAKRRGLNLNNKQSISCPYSKTLFASRQHVSHELNSRHPPQHVPHFKRNKQLEYEKISHTAGCENKYSAGVGLAILHFGFTMGISVQREGHNWVDDSLRGPKKTFLRHPSFNPLLDSYMLKNVILCCLIRSVNSGISRPVVQHPEQECTSQSNDSIIMTSNIESMPTKHKVV